MKVSIKEKICYIYQKMNFVIEFVISFFLMLMAFKLVYMKSANGYWAGRYCVIVAVLLIVLVAIMIDNIRRHRQKVAKVFLNFMIPLGMAYLIFMMPTYVPDEQAHVYRAYEIGVQGKLIPQLEDGEYKTFVPKQMKESMKGYANNYIQLVQKEKEVTDYSELDRVENPARGYFPTLYIFSAIVFLTGKIFSINSIIVMYLARIPNYIVFLILGYYSIKKIPFGKLLVLAYLFMPMSIQQAASISADSLTNSISIFFIAYTLFLAYQTEPIKKSQKCIYYISAALLGVAKVVYMPIVALALMLLNNKQEKKKTWKMIIISALICAICSGAWYLYSSRYTSESIYVKINHVNSSEQIQYILHNPGNYIKALGRTLHQYGEWYIYSFIGQDLSWLDIHVPNLTIVGFAILLLAAPFLGEKMEYHFDKKMKLYFVLIVVLEVVLVLTAMYLTWTSVGGDIMLGIQGRYFIPVMLILLLILCMKDKQLDFKYINIIYPTVLCLLNLSALQQIVRFFI